ALRFSALHELRVWSEWRQKVVTGSPRREGGKSRKITLGAAGDYAPTRLPARCTREAITKRVIHARAALRSTGIKGWQRNSSGGRFDLPDGCGQLCARDPPSLTQQLLPCAGPTRVK